MNEDRPSSNPPRKATADTVSQEAPPASTETGSPPQESPVGSHWLRLCQGADQLEHAVLKFAEGGDPPDKAAISYLETVLEDFPMPEDPSGNVRSFAVHRLAYSIYEAVVTLGSR